MNNATEDLKLLYISNLNTIRELNSRIEQLESEKNNQNISGLDTIKELNNRVEQIESEKHNQQTSNLDTINGLNNRVEQLESENSIQFLQWARGIIAIMDTFEKLKKAFSKKLLNKSNKDKKVVKRYKKVGRSLEALLLQFEITRITFPDNQLIAGFYKVVGTEPDENKPDDTILSIVKNGYIRGAGLIREAEVIVVKNHKDDHTEISEPVLNNTI